ncbi:MAG: beta-aspartyl-peptidase, partial [Gammaproteobacteria bacterium]|nr:beta-aspartyl-peptidase [Gammaproteobacteria bacterium]
MFKLLLTLFIWIPAMSLAAPYAIVIHGGAGTILRDKMSSDVEDDYRRVLTAAIKAGHAVLARGDNSSDAVIAAILV